MILESSDEMNPFINKKNSAEDHDHFSLFSKGGVRGPSSCLADTTEFRTEGEIYGLTKSDLGNPYFIGDL